MKGEPFGLQGEGPGAYVLHCDKGEWVPLMTAQEYVDIVQKKPVQIAPVPTRPTTTTTAVPAAPAITSMWMGGGPAEHLGEMTDRVIGTGFSGTTAVYVDGTSVWFEAVAGSESTALEIELPTATAGSVDIKVVTPHGTDTLVDS